MIVYKTATIEDIDEILKLHSKYQIDTISSEDKNDGFVTTSFSVERLKELIQKEKSIFIAKNEDGVIAYAMNASWQFWQSWPMFSFMMNDLHTLNYKGDVLSINNSYQYGPVCVDKKYRGKGILENLFELSRQNMSVKYPYLITFINKINTRSFNAHTKKLQLEVIKEFTYNNNNYYELIYDTSKSAKI